MRAAYLLRWLRYEGWHVVARHRRVGRMKQRWQAFLHGWFGRGIFDPHRTGYFAPDWADKDDNE